MTPPSSFGLVAATRTVAVLDPMRVAGAVLFIALRQAATAVVSPIILPEPFSVLRRVAADFWPAPALSYYGVEDQVLSSIARIVWSSAIAKMIACSFSTGTADGSRNGAGSAGPWTFANATTARFS
jgi:ABC-type nitrate/sulfonate/bicarbonate transport system permease component